MSTHEIGFKPKIFAFSSLLDSRKGIPQMILEIRLSPGHLSCVYHQTPNQKAMGH